MTLTPSLVERLRMMGRQYAMAQGMRSGVVKKHYLEDAADALERQSAELAALRADVERLRDGLKYYANGVHLTIKEDTSWDKALGVEEGAVARATLLPPACGACPGDESICPTTCRVADESPPIAQGTPEG